MILEINVLIKCFLPRLYHNIQNPDHPRIPGSSFLRISVTFSLYIVSWVSFHWFLVRFLPNFIPLFNWFDHFIRRQNDLVYLFLWSNKLHTSYFLVVRIFLAILPIFYYHSCWPIFKIFSDESFFIFMSRSTEMLLNFLFSKFLEFFLFSDSLRSGSI